MSDANIEHLRKERDEYKEAADDALTALGSAVLADEQLRVVTKERNRMRVALRDFIRADTEMRSALRTITAERDSLLFQLQEVQKRLTP